MPHLRVRALDITRLKKISTTLIDKLYPIMQCPPADFTIEHIPSEFVGPNKPYPFVEVLWFNRGQDVQDKSAAIITKLVQTELEEGEEDNKDVAVVFHPLTASMYYDNGVHY
jgi:phenylpyruvate tautomerase PptA (4-oxalocrotonate tautomerase family)